MNTENASITTALLTDTELDDTTGGYWGAIATGIALAYFAYDVYQGYSKHEPSVPYVTSEIYY